MKLGRTSGFREMVYSRLLTWALERTTSGDALD
jgi:hypothetical protein